VVTIKEVGKSRIVVRRIVEINNIKNNVLSGLKKKTEKNKSTTIKLIILAFCKLKIEAKIIIIIAKISISLFLIESFLFQIRMIEKIAYGPNVPKVVKEPRKLAYLVKPSLPPGSARKSKLKFSKN
jgi:hypothetical protein